MSPESFIMTFMYHWGLPMILMLVALRFASKIEADFNRDVIRDFHGLFWAGLLIGVAFSWIFMG